LALLSSFGCVGVGKRNDKSWKVILLIIEVVSLIGLIKGVLRPREFWSCEVYGWGGMTEFKCEMMWEGGLCIFTFLRQLSALRAE
jgi:hypothetical protein